MIQRIIVETAETIEAVRTAIGKNGEVETHEDGYVVIVHDSHDAEDEVTEALNDAGISAYVYEQE